MNGRRLRPITLIVLVMVFCSSCDSGNELEQRNWQLLWADDFEGPANQPPDSTRWTYDIGTDWGNAQLEYDTDRIENSSLDGQGNLVITARRESFEGRPFTSARLVTRGLFERAYGRFEARMKMPQGRGLWPAFWLLGANTETVGWPLSGEIDIMEYRGQEPSFAHGSLHGPGYSAGEALTRKYTLVEDRFDTGFHTFAVEWSPNTITWYVNDTPYQTLTPEDLPRGEEWVYDHPFYIILNLAVGGNYVGTPNGNTTFPQTLVVDWVRVYEDVR